MQSEVWRVVSSVLLRATSRNLWLRPSMSRDHLRNLHGMVSCARPMPQLKAAAMSDQKIPEQKNDEEPVERTWCQLFFHVGLWLGVAVLAGLCSVIR